MAVVDEVSSPWQASKVDRLVASSITFKGLVTSSNTLTLNVDRPQATFALLAEYRKLWRNLRLVATCILGIRVAREYVHLLSGTHTAAGNRRSVVRMAIADSEHSLIVGIRALPWAVELARPDTGRADWRGERRWP